MSVAVKMRHIEVVFGKKSPELFLVPLDKANSIKKLIEEYKHNPDDDEYIDADELFKHLEEGRGKVAVLIAGYRHRDEITQAELAEKLGTHQSAIAAMESGKRPIGKVIAKKLAEIFDTDYRNFL